MKKTRRIEITAFRRTTRLSRGTPQIELSEEFSQNQTDGLRSTDDCPARIEQLDLVEAILSSVDDGRSPEMPQLIEALAVSDGAAARAAQEVGLSRNRFYSKLRSLELSVKNLKANLDRIGDKKHKPQQGEPK